jgi:hypothetical protein
MKSCGTRSLPVGLLLGFRCQLAVPQEGILSRSVIRLGSDSSTYRDPTSSSARKQVAALETQHATEVSLRTLKTAHEQGERQPLLCR